MANKYQIVASIVLYETAPEVVNEAIKSFLNTDLTLHLYLSDNSPTDELESKIHKDPRITYHFNNKNLGFGPGHNKSLKALVDKSDCYLVLNPDVYFDSVVLVKLYHFMQNNAEVGITAPKVFYPSGVLQHSCRLIPTPFDLFIRRMPLLKQLYIKKVKEQQYNYADCDEIRLVPFLLGCFMFVRSSAFQEAGAFDERFFMYMEDLDLCRRIGSTHKIVYYGDAHIYHHYQRASSRSLKMFTLHFISMIKYFNKWGWLSDEARSALNYKAQEEPFAFSIPETQHIPVLETVAAE